VRIAYSVSFAPPGRLASICTAGDHRRGDRRLPSSSTRSLLHGARSATFERVTQTGSPAAIARHVTPSALALRFLNASFSIHESHCGFVLIDRSVTLPESRRHRHPKGGFPCSREFR
jgi:hypothetical protein